MQQSRTSYRSNRYTTQSRKIPPYNPTNYQTQSPTASLLQQQQIQQLQQKVDMILLHNNQLIQQNVQLKHKLELISIREADARYSLDGNMDQVYRLKLELEAKCRELDQLNRKRALENSGICTQFDELNLVIKQLQLNHEKTLLQNEQINQKYTKLSQQHTSQLANLRQQLQNQLYQTSLKKQIEHKQQLREKQYQLNQILQKKIKQWQQQKIQIEQKKLNMIIDLQDRMKKQKQEERIRIQEQYRINIQKLENDAEERCRKNRQQAQSYIKTMLEEYKYEQKPEEQLKKQIQNLKSSLQERQKTIQNLLKFQTKSSAGTSYYNQVQQLRTRIKQLTEDFFKQSQILKVKMAVKHDIDVRQTIRVYDNKIDVLTAHITILEADKFRLREKYEEQIRSKMKQRQRFEIQVSKLKNYIRKMKIQLQSYGKEMRLNIEGIRDQANSFSMSILGQLGQEKNKKNFYQQQIRKMREVIDLKEHQIQVLTKQCEEKLKYYDQKLKVAKETINDLSQQLQSKQQKFTDQIERLRQNTKQQINRQKDYLQQTSAQYKNQINELRKQVQTLDLKNKQYSGLNSTLQKNVQKLTHELQSCKSHIDSLQIQLQMAHQPPQIPDNKSLRQHYERIIQQIQHDKQILKQTNSKQAEQMAKLVAKYKVLQKSVQKTLSTMKKRTDLEERVLEVGLDENLVKNLAEVFKKQQSSSNMRLSRQIKEFGKQNV